MNTITLAGINYQIGKTNALTQFHVLRRLAPVLAPLGSVALSKGGKLEADDFLEFIGPLTDALANLPEADANYVIFSCLAVVKREVADGRYAPIVAGQQFMFEDIDMVAMIRLTVEVVQDNLSGFFAGLGGVIPSTSS